MDNVKPEWAVAIDGEDTQELRSLLQRKRSLLSGTWRDVVGGSTWTPLGYAISNGKASMMQVLLEEGARPNEKFTEARAQDGALGLGGFDIEPTRVDTWVPLSKAIDMNRADMVRALLQWRADALQDSAWPLLERAIFKSSYAAQVHFIQLLLERGAGAKEVLAARDCLFSSLKTSFEIVQLLLEHGAGAKDKLAERDYVAYAAAHKCHHRVIGLLLEHGASGENIKALDFSGQSLEALPLWLLRCPNLKKLTLAGSPLSTVPAAIRNERLPVLLDYLRDIKSSGKMLWVKSKVMVLGKEGVGKTHILRRLQNEAYDRNESTNGVDINEFQLGDKELTWFDFGGQEVFYPTHQFFLTAQCVYVLVFRLNDADCAERVQHWLRTVVQFTRDPKRAAKVIVVATHADALQSQQAQDAVWDKLRPILNVDGNVTATVTVSCKTGVGFKVNVAATFFLHYLLTGR
jgi:hypothetical protein